MAEPTSTAAATLLAATASLPIITAFGIPLGLRADLLVAGFAGALVAIILLNTVPATDDTLREMVHAKQWLLTTLAMLIVAGIVYALQRPEWAYVAITAPAVFGAIYKLFPAARLRIEAAAYRLQLTYYPDDRSALFAGFLATNYSLAITQDQALQALRT